MNKKELSKLIKEKEKRIQLKAYSLDFAKFAEEQIKIVTKDATQGFVPFKLNNSQKYITEKLQTQLEETGKVRAIILKARQQGISTYCAGRVFWKTYFAQHTRSVVMAHDSATSDALFSMSKSVIQNMQGDLKPQEDRSNAKEIIIKTPAYTDKAAKGSYRLYTAGAPEAGRGTTPTIAHLSEVAFWQHDEKILAGLFQGISQAQGTEVILESTANGAQGEFYRLWKGAVAGENEYTPIFLPWFWTPEYTREAPEGMELTDEEEKIKNNFNLSLGQLYWRRLKIAESGELKFKQEYPSTADEAFVVSGANVFDIDKLNSLIPQPILGTKTWDNNSKMFDNSKEGKLHLWDYPKFDTPYVIAADVSLGVGQDYSTAVVLDKEYKVLGLYRDNHIDPSTFGELLFYLGRYYNNAFLCVESNSMGIATLQRLEAMNYVNMYKQTKIANVSNEEGVRLGFRTTLSTKPAIIGNLKKLINDEALYIPSNIMIQELKDYISTSTGRTEAAPGTHDDTVMALAMACEVMRTHYDRLVLNRISWKDRMSNWEPDNTNWL
mgnify:FL=1|tara:strand:- start:9102 stop:10754 length:1653 start_codon:yes stop_codon:yes gene_type:complete